MRHRNSDKHFKSCMVRIKSINNKAVINLVTQITINNKMNNSLGVSYIITLTHISIWHICMLQLSAKSQVILINRLN